MHAGAGHVQGFFTRSAGRFAGHVAMETHIVK